MANLKLLGAVSGYTELQAASAAVPTTFTLPATDGTSGQIMSTNGQGQLQFITNQAASYTLPTATTTVLGGVRVDGSSITINGSGVISSASAYTLPTASVSVLGGVRVGAGLAISNGVLSTSGAASSQADSLLVGASYRTATIDEPYSGTPYSIACRDLDGNLSAVLFQGTALAAQFADLAEKYLGDVSYEPGTVLEFGGDKEVTLASAETVRVAGIVSTNPGFIMNNDLAAVVTQGERTIILALTGRVPCKVKGQVRKGDLMISAGDGYAKASTNPTIGQVIGKALENSDEEENLIEVVVGRM